MTRRRIVVVGGGIAGLVAAYRVTRIAPDATTILVERDGRLGGKILTERVDGFTIEGGPDSFLSTKPRGLALCEELGLADRLQGTNEGNRRTFVMRDGRLYDLPEGLTGLVPTRLGPMAKSPLISPLGKARMGLDYLLPRRKSGGDESIAAFVRRRLGREVYQRLVEPLMGGIYAGDGEQLSLAATFPQLRQGELHHGGLIKGVLAARKAAPTPAAPRPPFLSLVGGMGELVETLADRLRAANVQIVLGAAVTALHRAGEGYRLTYYGGDTLSADAVILAVPAFSAADLLADLDPELAEVLRAIPFVSTATVSVAYPLQDVSRPLQGSGYVIPRAEGRPILACTWTSSKWPYRAREGYALIRVFIGRAGDDAAVAASDEHLLALTRQELRAILGITASPFLYRIYRWPDAMPQYTLGHLDRVAAIEQRLSAHPRLALAGASYRGIGLPDCIRSGEEAAERIDGRG